MPGAWPEYHRLEMQVFPFGSKWTAEEEEGAEEEEEALPRQERDRGASRLGVPRPLREDLVCVGRDGDGHWTGQPGLTLRLSQPD